MLYDAWHHSDSDSTYLPLPQAITWIEVIFARLHDWWNKMRFWNYVDKALKLRMNEVENVLEHI